MSHELQMMIVTKRKRLDISILIVTNKTFTPNGYGTLSLSRKDNPLRFS